MTKTYTLAVLQGNGHEVAGVEMVDPAITFDKLVNLLEADGLEDAAYVVNSTTGQNAHVEEPVWYVWRANDDS